MSATAMKFSHIASPWYFYKIWRSDFPHVKVARAVQLGYCDTCTKYDNKIRNANSPQARAIFSRVKYQHLQDIMRGTKTRNLCIMLKEREEQARRDMSAALNPSVFMSITMDAKAPLPLPSFVRPPKGCIKAVRVPLNIYGIINWGFSMFEYHVHFDHWPTHDANIAISYLWDHIRRVIVEGMKSNIQKF